MLSGALWSANVFVTNKECVLRNNLFGVRKTLQFYSLKGKRNQVVCIWLYATCKVVFMSNKLAHMSRQNTIIHHGRKWLGGAENIDK